MAKGTFGERLKRERELREVTLEEVSKATRISERFLEALENEDWKRLPGGVFGRGFVRSIARYLGLGEENLLSEYDLARGEIAAPASAKPEERIPSPPKWIPVALVLAVLLLLGGLVFGTIFGWRKFKEHHLSKKSSNSKLETPPKEMSPALNTPASRSISYAPEPVAIPLELVVSTSTATHVRILADHNLVLDTDLPAGENRRFSASSEFDVSASDSSAVLLELNGSMMPPLGSPSSFGRMVLSAKDLRQVSGGISRP